MLTDGTYNLSPSVFLFKKTPQTSKEDFLTTSIRNIYDFNASFKPLPALNLGTITSGI